MTSSPHITLDPQLVQRFQDLMYEAGAQWAGTTSRSVSDKLGASRVIVLSVNANEALDLGLSLDGTFEGHAVWRRSEIVPQ